MSNSACPECGSTNAPGTQFCVECDSYLGWTSAPPAQATAAPSTPAQPSSTTRTAPRVSADAARVVVPTVETDTTTATLEPDTGVVVELRMYNPSPIVDGYRVELPASPGWLTVEHGEIRLMPHTDSMIPVTFTLDAGSSVTAQSIQVPLRVRSLTDPEKYTDAEIELVIPRSGRPVGISAHPTLVRLVDETVGTTRIDLDNTASNYPQTLVLNGSDAEGAVQFSFTPATIEIPAGGTASADLRFEAPVLDYGTQTSRQLTVSATGDDDTPEAQITVSQQRSDAPEDVPAELRLEPSVLRVVDFSMADLSLVIDNRRGSADRSLAVAGRDPENKVRFSFATASVFVPAGDVAVVRLSVQSTPPPEGEETSKSFTVVAADADEELEVAGTLTLVTSTSSITTASLQLHPSRIQRRNSASARFKVIVDNTASGQWLNVGLSGSDPEAAVRFNFSPARFEVPAGQSMWAWASVKAPQPEPGGQVERSFTVEGSDGREKITAEGTFVQHTSDWMPTARVVLTVLGGITAIVGALTPWAITLPDYYFDRLLSQSPDADIVEQTQPAVRLAVIVLAAAMMWGITGKTGKLTRTSAVLMATAVIGYLVYLTTTVGTGGPMYGAILVVAGAVIGGIGGLCIRRS